MTSNTAAALCCCWRCWPIASRFWMVHEPRSSAMLELTDSAFSRVQRLLPADSRRGKPWRDHRQVLGGILWKLHTGRPWRDVPGRFGPVRALADLPWPAAALAAGWDLVEGVGAAGRWRRAGLRRRSRWPARPGAAGGGASGSVGRGLDGGAATTTTPAPAAPSAVSTTPARPAADAPPRSRPGPGPTLEVVAILRGQPPPLPARAVAAAWARTAARNAWATRTRVTCRYQPSQRRTW